MRAWSWTCATGRPSAMTCRCWPISSPQGNIWARRFYRAGGVPAIMGELAAAGRLHEGAQTISGRTVGEAVADWRTRDPDVIRPYHRPLRENAGFLVLSGNLFDSALMKTSVISDDFRRRFLSKPGSEKRVRGPRGRVRGPRGLSRADQRSLAGHRRGNHPVHPGVGCVGYPGSAEVVNMQPPDALIKAGINHLPTVGDGRQSGTSESPSILNASPESVVGGGLAYLKTGDRVRLDLNECTLNALVPEEEWEARKAAWAPPKLHHQTPWQEIYRTHVGQLADGGCLELATAYRQVAKDLPRDNH
ncbi:dihydroxy-acid dehydratase [Jhaorihella thermophila]